MTNLRDFHALTALLAARGTKKRLVVVNPEDESTLWAIDRAQRAGFCEAVPVHEDDPEAASRHALELIRSGKADVLMKGLINTDILLRAILNKEHGILRPGHILTHIAAAAIPAYDKLLFFTDAAVLPFPTEAQRVAQVRYLVDLCHSLGVEVPKVSLIHSSEQVDGRHFPYTEGYRAIREQALQGAFGHCVVDGPLDLKTSCDYHAMQVKKISSPIKGQADALVFPNIEAGNVFYKAITLFCNATTAAILQGTQVPVVLPSRGDSPETKYNSIALACVV